MESLRKAMETQTTAGDQTFTDVKKVDLLLEPYRQAIREVMWTVPTCEPKSHPHSL